MSYNKYIPLIALIFLVFTLTACNSKDNVEVVDDVDENITDEPLELSPEVDIALDNEKLTTITPEDYPKNDNIDADEAYAVAEKLATGTYGATLSKYKVFKIMVTPEAAETAGVTHIDAETASTAVDAIGYNWMINANNYKEQRHPDYVHGESDIVPVVDDMTTPNGGGFTAEEAIYALTYQP